ncbi:MAG: hypothetical protein ACK48X_16125 [Planctomycetota bacterium]
MTCLFLAAPGEIFESRAPAQRQVEGQAQRQVEGQVQRQVQRQVRGRGWRLYQ